MTSISVQEGMKRKPMTIFTLCVDPERGKYLAFFGEDPIVQEVSYTSTDEAVGKLMKKAVGWPVSKIVVVDALIKSESPAASPAPKHSDS